MKGFARGFVSIDYKSLSGAYKLIYPIYKHRYNNYAREEMKKKKATCSVQARRRTRRP